MQTKIGYARVSTVGQSLESQIQALTEQGCIKIFQEKISGKTTENRDELKKALDYIREGDVLIVTKLDRLARSISDLWTTVSELERKGAALIVLDQPLIDTTKPEGKLVMTMFGYVAETERNLILERTEDGRQKAKAAGVKFGRKDKLTGEQTKAMLDEFAACSGSAAAVAKKYGVSRATLYRLAADAGVTRVDMAA